MRNLFGKLMITYLIILVFTIGGLAMILSQLFTDYVFNYKSVEMQRTANTVQRWVSDYYSKDKSNLQLDSVVDVLGDVTESSIYVVEVPKGTDLSKENLQKQFSDEYLVQDIAQILSGKSINKSHQYSNQWEMEVVFVGVPLYKHGEINGAILLFSPTTSVTSVMKNINLSIGILSILTIIVGAFLIYRRSLTITLPLKKLEVAAEDLALGKNVEDVDIDSKDEIGRLGTTFNAMKNQLQESQKMSKDFVANVSHDLRTPLTAIQGYTEALVAGIVPTEEVQNTIIAVNKQVRGLCRRTGDLLEVAKIQGGIILHKEYCNVAEMIAETLDSVEHMALQKDIDLIWDGTGEVDLYVDPATIRQALYNLIQNAIKYTEQGSVEITVLQEKETITITIQDTGIGIPQDKLPYIFDKFYRVDSVREMKEGSGLGLYITKTMIELHGGKIEVLSHYGRGTTMKVQLPI